MKVNQGFISSQQESNHIPPGFRATAAFFNALKPVKRAKVPGRANDDVENMMGITPELFTCQNKMSKLDIQI